MNDEDAGKPWVELERDEEDAVWDRLERQFAFRPSIYAKDWPGIVEPAPFATFKLAQPDYSYPHPDFRPSIDRVVDPPNELLLPAFKQLTDIVEKLYVLDWNHTCYWFYPHRPLGNWKTTVYPQGDYSVFLAPDFTYGTFGHPWEETLCVFGEMLLPLVDAKLTQSLGPAIRRG